MPETPNTFNKKMIKDLNDSFLGKDVWEHARNMVVNTHNGDLFTLSNEPSTEECYTFESLPLSKIALKNDRFLIIQLSGEFGILNVKTCTYEMLFQLQCKDVYQFTKRPILGKSRIVNNKDEYVVFGNIDIPVSELNLSDIPYSYTIEDDECKTKKYTKQVDCKELYLFKEQDSPDIELKVTSGNLPNGTYQVALGYAIDDVLYTAYNVSLPIQIYNKNNNGGGIDIQLSNLDRDFDKFQLVLISNNTGDTNVNVETYIINGLYSTGQTNINISDLSGTTETLENLVIERKTPSKVGNIASNSEYLLLSDIIYQEPISYQKQAMNIEVEYVITQVPLNFYENNFDVGYFGDENYAPVIRWVTDKNERSNLFHIPGPKKTSKDSTLANSDNAYEYDANTGLTPPDKLEVWEIENTASKPINLNEPFIDNKRILATGKPGYFESTLLYPDNDIFGDDKCTPIRYPKFPDETKVPRFEVINGATYINIKSWRFSNIEHPLDKSGNPLTNIKGYEILRKKRDKTVLATGYISNIRGFEENGETILYQNYPYNDRSPDSFHSLKQTSSKNNKEIDFQPLTKVYDDKFAFYSPDANYRLKTSLGEEFKIYTEEKAQVKGRFEEVFQHPEAKLMTNFSLYLSGLMGVIEAFLELNGKICRTKQNTNLLTFPTTTGAQTTINNPSAALNPTANKLYEECDTTWHMATNALEDIKLGKVERTVLRVLQTTAKVVGFTLLAAQKAEIWLNIIENFSKERQYAYQYNSVANFTESKPVNKRRFVKNYQYIFPTNTGLPNGDVILNNKSNKFIYVEVQKDILPSTYIDNSNITLTEARKCKDVFSDVNTSATMFYAYSKRSNKNQYGTLETGRYVKTHNNIIHITYEEGITYTSPVIYGGDCLIVQDSFETKRQIFSQSFANQNFPDGLFINFRNYPNLAHPRFWYDSEKYEIADIVSKSPKQGKLPAQKHNFDCRKNSKNAFTVKDEYMYTSVNGVVNYIIETDANLWYREQDESLPHYSRENMNLSEIFRSDRLEKEEVFKLNSAYFKLEADQVYGEQAPEFTYKDFIDRDKNGVIYSLPGFSFQKVNNWRYFLSNNYYSFDNGQFGNLIGVHSLDQEKLIFLFDKSSPYVSVGRSELQTTDGTITIGDAGLFARKPLELMNTDVAYGSTESKYAFSSNQFGKFYPSSNQGRIFKFTNNLEDITREGIHYWAKNFMGFKLKEYFPNYLEEENPLNGVSYLSVFDNDYETLYICKKDYIPIQDGITYINNNFYYEGVIINLQDELYFKDVSFTISYHPQNEGFISFHDWLPDQVLQLENHFITQKNNTFWKHNISKNSFCNFYAKDYSFEIIPVISNNTQIGIVNSFEYYLKAYHYLNNGLDKYDVLKENFDFAEVYNDEQHSGVLNLITETKVTEENSYKYPEIINAHTTNVLCIKKENKFRFNGFKDNTKDRGEISNLDAYLIKNDPNGYSRSLYTQNINTKKPFVRIRNKVNKVRLLKTISKNTNFIFQFLNTNQSNSPR